MNPRINAQAARGARQTEVDFDDGPGVPEALPRALRELGERLGTESIDRLWIFPPLIRGRREWGLVAVGCFDGSGARRLVTARYGAQRTGKGLYLDIQLVDQGVAPADRLPRVMEGVVRRGPAPLGSPKQFEVGGSAEGFDAVMRDFADELFAEAVLGPPLAE